MTWTNETRSFAHQSVWGSEGGWKSNSLEMRPHKVHSVSEHRARSCWSVCQHQGEPAEVGPGQVQGDGAQGMLCRGTRGAAGQEAGHGMGRWEKGRPLLQGSAGG